MSTLTTHRCPWAAALLPAILWFMDTSTTWTNPALAREPVAWLGTAASDGQAALVPTWFAWDGEAFLVASKPGARKVHNALANPRVMVGIARIGVEMEAQLVEGRAEVLAAPAAEVFRDVDLGKYDGLLDADGLTREAFLARYSAVIRIVPTRFLPWQGPALARAPEATPGEGRHPGEGRPAGEGRHPGEGRPAAARRPLADRVVALVRRAAFRAPPARPAIRLGPRPSMA